MTRRLAGIVATIAATIIFPVVALGATGVTHIQVRGEGLTAEFSNVPEGTVPPGDYFGAILGAGSFVGRGDGAFVNDSLCLGVDETRLDPTFGWGLERSYSACGPISSLTVRGDLGTAHLVASFAATCEAYRQPSWDCGQMDIDLTLTGVGPLTQYRDVTVTGDPGAGRAIERASGASRSAVYAAGHVTLDGREYIGGSARITQAWIWDLQRGTITIGL